MDQRICVSSFYFTFLTVLIIMLAALVIFQYSENKKDCPVCPVCPLTQVNPINPSVIDDLRQGELPARDIDYRKINDPLKEPSRRFDGYPNGYPGLLPVGGNINIATKGYLPSYQQMGYLTPLSQNNHTNNTNTNKNKNKNKNKKDKKDKNKKDDQEDDQEKHIGADYERQDPDRILKIFGRRIDSYKYEYYVIHHFDSSLKIPIQNNRDQELYQGDTVRVPGYPDQYVVHLYDYDGPKYIPHY